MVSETERSVRSISSVLASSLAMGGKVIFAPLPCLFCMRNYQ